MMNRTGKKTELLSPAGSFDILKAVALAGADAVYAAGQQFGARAYADNLTKKELLEGLDYLHLKEKRLYLTVNTLLKNRELERLYDYLYPLYEAGLDGVIVQDIGVLHFVREHFPGLPIHASTQMNITGAYGAKLLLEAGCSRIVTARELSLEEISHIYETTGAEIESFVHGALCYSHSGQCLLSSMIGGRSGNRGRCAQPCRLPWELCSSKGEILNRNSDGNRESSRKNRKDTYLLSPRDLCAVELIPRLIQSGVHSFKIEGRMKQAEYAAGVTGMYRKYLDICENDPKDLYEVSGEDKTILRNLGSRCGFTDGYYTRHNGKDMITFLKPSHEKNREQGQELFRQENKEKIKGFLRVSAGTPLYLMLRYKDIQAEVTGEQVQPAQKQPLTRETVLDKMKKTGNTPFVFEELQVELEGQAFVTISALNQIRREGLLKLQEEILKKYRRSARKPGETVPADFPGSAPEQKMVTDSRKSVPEQEESAVSVWVQKKKPRRQIPEIRVLTETPEQFQAALKQQEVSRIYPELPGRTGQTIAEQVSVLVAQAHKAGKECWPALPYIFRMETARRFESCWRELEASGADGYLIRNYEEIRFLKERGVGPERIQGDYSLYVYSNEALRGFSELPLHYFTLPAELNFQELKENDCSRGEMILYGRQPLMVSSQCVHKNTAGCSKKETISYLKDRYGKLFPVKNRCQDCYNVIYNISPLALFHHMKEISSLGPAGLRLSFTIEDQEETEHIFALFRQACSGNSDRQLCPADYTNGHFKRGVE